MNNMFYNTEYSLKYKNDTVLRFNIHNKSVTLVNSSLLPISLQNKPCNFSLIHRFCSDRMLMLNREYCKEILTACGIDDQNDINICIICKGLSFRDNYWITKSRSSETWEEVNLYNNEFSLNIAKVALTGNTYSNSINNIIGDRIFTGELTNKGTRAKCFYRENNNLFLCKHETRAEIMSEIVTFYIAQALGVPCSEYRIDTLFGKECSVCQIFTSETYELIPCRDVMSHFNSTRLSYEDEVYTAFMSIDPINFIKMQILDYVTLNTDRNRDNYALLRVNGKLVGIYPLFDHDSCFKGKGTNGLYFPTGVTFAKTLDILKSLPYYNMLYDSILNFKDTINSPRFKELFLNYKSFDEYISMLNRVNKL